MASAAIGLRVKTGRATAVLLAGPCREPSVLARVAVSLTDPREPSSFQPYHAALELPEREGAAVVKRACAAVRAVARRELGALVADVRARGCTPIGVGLVVGSDVDPAKLGNAHVRAHALEGRLFREVLDEAAEALELPRRVVLEKRAFADAAEALERTRPQLEAVLKRLGKEVGAPWGAEQKTAALVAWMLLDD